MKTLKLIFVLFLFANFSFAQSNYIVIVENDSIPTNLNETVTYTLKDGKKINLKVVQPKYLTYSDHVVSFKHPSNLSVSTSVIEIGIEQTMAATAMGTGFLVQKFDNIDPTEFVRFMLNEITKESVHYGFTKEEEPFTKELKSGQTLTGIKATLTYKGDKEVYTVSSYGEKDQGVIVVTMTMDFAPDDLKTIDLFLDTLELKY